MITRQSAGRCRLPFAIALFCLVLTLFPALSRAGDTPDMRAAYRLGPGDTLKITVYDEEQLTDEYRIDGNNRISMPLIGEIRAGGRSVGELRRQITDRLAAGYIHAPDVSVEVVTYRPFFILGEVRAPGSYDYIDGMRILNAVALAGGFTYRAEQDRIEVVRYGEQDPEASGDDVPVYSLTTKDAVLPGDIITVRERFF